MKSLERGEFRPQTLVLQALKQGFASYFVDN